MKAQVKSLLEKFKLPRLLLEDFIADMNLDIDKAFKPVLHQHASLKMIPTYVCYLPNGSEQGDYFALDLGGTNFRVLLVQLKNNKATMSHQTFPIFQEIMQGTAGMLFGYIAECLENFVKDKLGADTKKISTVGFTFSFPCLQDSLVSGRLDKWTKGFNVSGVEGEDVCKLLLGAIQNRNVIEVEQIALLNDTTGVMMSCAYDDPTVAIGLILGTGTNACYMENINTVLQNERHNGTFEEGTTQVILNTEWGALGGQVLQSLQTEFDRNLDRESLYKGEQLFEKMISGMYLGEIVRQCMLSLIKDFILFNGKLSPQLSQKDSFTTIFVSDFCTGKAKRVTEILTDLGYENATIEECRVIHEICLAVSLRAARLAAAGLTTIIRHLKKDSLSVAVDGSLYKKHPTFKQFMHQALEELLPTTKVHLRLAEDGSGRGAAIVAAVAQRLAQERQK